MEKWENIPDIDRLMKSVAAGTAESGLETVDQILLLQGTLPSETLQEAYVDALLALVARRPGSAELEEINRRLRATPTYSQNQSRMEEHAQALAKAAAAARDLAQGRSLVAAFLRIKGYGSSLVIQKAHADALFALSNLPEALPLVFADEIAAIPSFQDEPEIQFAYAKACCNATARENPKQADLALRQLASIPMRSEHAEIEESYQRALRNRERLKELNPSSSPMFSRNQSVAAAALLGLALVGGVVAAFQRGDESKQPIASSSPSLTTTRPEDNLSRELEEAQKALNQGNNEQAITLGLKARQSAESLLDSKSETLALDVVGTAHFAMDKQDQALVQWKEILQANLPSVIERHVQLADQALGSSDKVAASKELGILTHLESLLSSQPDRALLQRLAETAEKGDRKALAARVRERMEDYAKAAELAEEVGDLPSALRLWQAVAQKNPEKKSELAAFRIRAGERAVKAAEAALATDQLQAAHQDAKAALEVLEGAPKSGELRARGLTVLAKVAYKGEQYSEALLRAKDAHTAAATPDRKERLEAYRLKDAQVVTRDELDVDTFVFPPPRQTNLFYTYAYWLGSEGDWVTRGTEELFESPTDELSVTPAFDQPEKGVVVGLVARDSRLYLFAFGAGGDVRLKPGTYDGATCFPFNIDEPGFGFEGNGRSNGKYRSRFVVHEISWTSDGQVESFAADFITANEGKPRGAYGKVRYNSHFE